MDYSERDIGAIAESAQSFVDVINKSLQMTQTSKVIKTKVSRLNLAKQRLEELKDLAKAHPFIKLTSLDAVERNIVDIENEFQAAGYFATEMKFSAATRELTSNVGEMQNKPLSAWGNGDLIVGLQFHATLQSTIS
jgi:hypothetical protein